MHSNFVKYTLPLLISFSLVSILFFPSCSQLSELSKVAKPAVSIADMKVTGLSLQDIELTADVEIDNPNSLAIDLSSYSYALEINSRNFVAGNEQKGMNIKARQSSTIKVPVTLNYDELLQTFQSMRNRNESDFSFSADFGFDLPVLGSVNVPVQYSGKISVVKKPDISLKNFSVDKLSFSGADLIVELNVSNPNSFEFLMDQLDFQLHINGLESLSGSVSEKIQISPEGSQTIELPLSVSFLNAGMTAYRLLNGKDDLEYSLTGSTTVGSDLPYFKSSMFNFDKSGSIDINR